MINPKKKICFVTGSRADYGLMRELMYLVNNDSNCVLKIIVTGSHLSNFYGNTSKEIKEDEFVTTEKVPVIDKDDSACGISKSIGEGVKGITKALLKINP